MGGTTILTYKQMSEKYYNPSIQPKWETIDLAFRGVLQNIVKIVKDMDYAEEGMNIELGISNIFRKQP